MRERAERSGERAKLAMHSWMSWERRGVSVGTEGRVKDGKGRGNYGGGVFVEEHCGFRLGGCDVANRVIGSVFVVTIVNGKCVRNGFAKA